MRTRTNDVKRTPRAAPFERLATLVLLVAIAPPAWAQANDARPGDRVEPTPIQDAFDSETWREDPERVERITRYQLPPALYRQAVEARDRLRDSTIEQARGGAPWQPLGPRGDFGGRNGRMAGIHLRAIPSSSDYWVFAGASSGGVYRASGAAGPAWTSFGDGIPNPSARAFDVHPDDIDDIIVGTGDYRRYGGAGLYRRVAGTWTEITLPESPDAFFRVAFLPGQPDTILAAAASWNAGATGGVFRSTDGGANWQETLADACTDIVIHPTNPMVMYACVVRGQRGIYRSTDAGGTWSFLSNPVAPDSVRLNRGTLAICRDAPQTLAVIVEFNSALEGIFRSTNGGSSWDDITSGAEGIDLAGQSSHAQAIAFRPNDPDEIYVGVIELARTSDGGASWDVKEKEHGIAIGHADITKLAFSDVTGDDVLWILNDGGIYRHDISTGDTESWNGDTSTGLACSQIDYLDAELGLGAIGLQDNGVLRFESGVWDDLGAADGGKVEIIDPEGSELWFGHGLFAPLGWRVSRVIGAAEPEWTNNTGNHTQIFYDRYRDRMIAPDRNGHQLFTTPVSGTPSWTVATSLPSMLGGRFGIFGNELTGTTFYCTYFVNSILDRVDDFGGGNWTVTTLNVDAMNTHIVWNVHPSREVDGVVWAGLQGTGSFARMMRSTDSGANWTDMTNGLMVGAVRGFVQEPFDPDVWYIGTDIGVFTTTDGGQSWVPFQDGLPSVFITDIDMIIDPTNAIRFLVASTYGRGVWARTLAGPPVAYVDPRQSGNENGTYEHAFQSFGALGASEVPLGATIGLYGTEYATGGMLFDSQKTYRAYGGDAVVR